MNTHTYMAVLGLRGLHCSVRAFSSCGVQGLPSSCGAQASYCNDSCCRAWALGTQVLVAAACGLKSTCSIVVAQGISCPTSCGILLDHVLNPCPLCCQAVSHPLDHQGTKMICFEGLNVEFLFVAR